MIFLVLYDKEVPLHRFELKLPQTLIGKGKNCQVQLSEPTVSNTHAVIEAKGSDFIIRDLKSRNGTFVNGRRVSEAHLAPGDRIKLGAVELEFQVTESELQLDVIGILDELKAKLNQNSSVSFLLEKLEELVKENLQNIERLETLSKITTLLTKAFTLPEILTKILEVAQQVLKAERAAIIFQTPKGKFETKAQLGFKEETASVSQSALRKVFATGKPLLISDIGRELEFQERKSIVEQGIKAILAVPIKLPFEQMKGVVYLDTTTLSGIFSWRDLKLLEGFSRQISLALEKALLIEQEKSRLEEIISLRERAKYADELQALEKETRVLKESLRKRQFENLIGASPAIQRVFSLIRQIAPSDVTVLIEGETGTGKELVARAIHNLSPRSGNPMIVVNCAAIPENLLESELFGYEKGAFTGAHQLKKGKLELAHRGTVFLDEVGELPLSLQTRFLRVLQEREIERLGGKESIPVDIRIIAATNKDLSEEVKKGNFREDLFYRLNVFPIKIPPLRERKEDIALLSTYFLDKFSREFKKSCQAFTPEVKAWLRSHPWLGNVRELENKIQRAVLMSRGKFITLNDLGEEKIEKAWLGKPLKEIRERLEKKYLAPYLKLILEEAHGNITHAAKAAGVDWKTFKGLLERCGINTR
jgi:two-component system NtrC family response regulator